MYPVLPPPPPPQVETGSSITWKYPSVVLRGDHSVGEFYSVALTNNKQQVGGMGVGSCAPACPASLYVCEGVCITSVCPTRPPA